jgi:hypothetical protein
MTLRFAVLGVLLPVVTGCGTPDFYTWGRYQDSLYEMYLEPGSQQLADEVGRLVEQVERTEADGGAVPPGLRAHIGYLYASAGNQTAAVTWLNAEKSAFPESAVFIDGMLDRMGR